MSFWVSLLGFSSSCRKQLAYCTLTAHLGLLIVLAFSTRLCTFFLRYWVMLSLLYANPCISGRRNRLEFWAAQVTRNYHFLGSSMGPMKARCHPYHNPFKQAPGNFGGLGPPKLVTHLGVGMAVPTPMLVLGFLSYHHRL